MTRASIKAFTLLELLIAIAIFSLISVMAFSGLNSVLFNKEVVDLQLQRLANVQRTMLNLSRDIEQAANRPIRDELGSTQPAFSGGQNIDSTVFELSRFGWRNPAQQTRSELQRVAYSYEDNQLIRLYWHHLDHLQTDEPVRRVLLKDVERIDVRYLDKEWTQSWPRADLDENVEQGLPRAVEITLELKDWGKITRLFRLQS